MRTVFVALGVVVTTASCGYVDGEESVDTGTGRVESVSTTMAPATTTKKQAEKAAARAERRTQAFVDSCVEYVPTMADLGEELSTLLWEEAGKKRRELRASCRQIATSRPKQRTLLEQMIVEADAFLAANAPSTTVRKKGDNSEDEDGGNPTTTTAVPGATVAPATTVAVATTAAPATTISAPAPQNGISISCPPHERQAGTVFRAHFSVSTSGESRVVEWGIDYGNGQSRTAPSRSAADSQLYWYDYLSRGTYTVAAWIVDEKGRRSSDVCTAIWTES